MTEQTLLAAVHAAAQSPVPAAAAAQPQNKENSMSAPEKTAGPAADVKPTTAAELASAFPDLVSSIRSEAATAERQRIIGIEQIAVAGHDKLVTEMKADPAVTPEKAAVRILEAEKAARGQRMAAIKGVEDEAAGKAPATPTANMDRSAGKDPSKAAAAVPPTEIAARARQYMADQAKLGINVSSADAVNHVEKQIAQSAAA
jgi:hypothetical protein